ncbi:MAG TPA: hypothetical protein VGZ25_06380, partial [Gemmataceae bacterium]|nr:hypothetical protein [Gemmataceae bacterium]
MRRTVQNRPAYIITFVASLALLGLVALPWQTWAADPPKPLTLEDVKALQKTYEEERQAASTNGAVKKFSPDWFTRADAFAAKGAKA